jgi:DNA modification methylase
VSVCILIGDCREKLRELPDASVNCCVTSPPYFGLRDYGCEGQMGLELTPDEFVAGMVEVFREVRRALRDDGTLWLNIGDSYAGSGRGGYAGGKSGLQGSTEGQDISRVARGSQKLAGMHERACEAGSIGRAWTPAPPGLKQKDLIGIPWMLAFALRADGWYLRQDIIWSKPNPMPESVRDRCTKAHEYLFLLSKGPRYHFDAEAIAEQATGEAPGNKRATKGGRAYDDGASEHRTAANLHNIGARETRNKRSVWEVATQPFSEAHFATYPPALIEPCILAGCPKGGTVLDPFFGAGTTGLVADRLGRNCIGIELNPEYAALAERRLNADAPLFAEVKAA